MIEIVLAALLAYVEFGIILWMYLAMRGDVIGVRGFIAIVFGWSFLLLEGLIA